MRYIFGSLGLSGQMPIQNGQSTSSTRLLGLRQYAGHNLKYDSMSHARIPEVEEDC